MGRPFYLGIDAGGTGIKFVITEAQGQVLADGEVPTDPTSVTGSLGRLSAAVEEYRERLVAVGMACAGIVNPVAGTLGRSPNLPGWQDTPLADLVAGTFPGLPVALANDVNSALYGEFRHGAGRGCSSLIMIALGTGVGGGVIVDKKLMLGAHCGAGEIGHTMLDPQGPLCTCGSLGCIEAYAGSVGVLKEARRRAQSPACPADFREFVTKHGDGLTTRHLTALADQGDPTALAIFAWSGKALGQTIGNLINIFDPEKVIIGGGVARAGDHILRPVRETYPGMVLCRESARIPTVPAELGSLAAAIGSATLAREAAAGNCRA